MRKWAWGTCIAVVAALSAFLTFGPSMVETSMNIIDGKPLPKVRAEAVALHKTLDIIDLHSDTLMWNRNINDRASRGHMDMPRLKDGNVAMQVFSSVTKTPKNQNYDSNGADTDNITLLTMAQLQPIRTWRSLLERSLWHAAKLDQAVLNTTIGLTKITNAEMLDTMLFMRSKRQQRIGAMLSIEGLHNLEGKRENLDTLYKAGFRMAGLTHFFDNELAGSMHGIKKGGLTPFGRQIVADMESKGMIVDIAHLSHTGVAEVLAMARRPVVSSHGGVQATCKVNRNLTDDEIRGIAKTGGIIGIGYWEGALCDTSPAAAAKAIKHVRDLVGIQYAALGSDYDGATTVRFDTSQLVQVTQALLDEGFTESEIRAVMGDNARRVISEGIEPMRTKASA
jgi:membrane dipeptidase